MRIFSLFGLLGVVCGSLLLWGQDTQKLQAWEITAEEAAKENPIKPDEEILKESKVLFDSQCAMCHGKRGDGKGDLADTLGMKLSDLADPKTLQGLSDGALFAMITKGKGKMPSQEGRLPDAFKWKLVHYMRALSAIAGSSATTSGSATTATPSQVTSGGEGEEKRTSGEASTGP